MLRAALAFGVAAVTAVVAVQEPGQTTDPKTRVVVERASKYVENYRGKLAAIVCEERQIQTLIKPDGSTRKRRVLVSDLMFVKVGANPNPSSFRDVISVDGKPVRDRSDRLKKLFIEKSNAAATDKARAIAIESGRYDLGIPRIGESPLLPIGLLDSEFVSNFRFALADRTLSFDEIKSPTYMKGMRPGGMEYVPSHGSFILDPENGAVLSVTLTSEAPGDVMSRKFEARFDEHPTLKIFVPVEMAESYRFAARPKEDRFEAQYTYSAFRRFQVTTSEIIK